MPELLLIFLDRQYCIAHIAEDIENRVRIVFICMM